MEANLERKSGWYNKTAQPVSLLYMEFHWWSQDHRNKSRKEKPVFITLIITIIIIIITANLTVINKEPRTILYGVINAVKSVFITVHDKYGLP